MPFVATRKARRLEWQDVRPRNAEQDDAWEIANRAQPRFAREFNRTIRSVVDEQSRRRLLEALRAGDINRAVDAYPWLNSGDEASEAIWGAYLAGLQRVYSDTLAEGATAALGAVRAPFEVVSKAIGLTPKGGGTREIGGLAREFSPIPFSERWVDSRSVELVTNVSNSQRSALRNLILDMTREGRRPEEMLPQIERIVGLTERDASAVLNRENLLIEQGVPKEKRTQLLDRFSRKLLRRRAENIARTELIEAQSQGISDAWRVAREQGFIPDTAEEEWIASFGERTCRICEGLNGQRVPVGEPFESDIIGLIDRPPAHPSCRCTRILVQ